MAYGYQPMYFPTQPQMPQPQSNNGIIWVQGEAGAKSYLVAPNNTVQLWDSESQTIYLKSADGSGMPSMKILDYTIRNAPVTAQGANTATKIQDEYIYATKEDMDVITGEIEALKRRIDSITAKRTTTKKEGNSNE